jgi:hypothetical protein
LRATCVFKKRFFDETFCLRDKTFSATFCIQDKTLSETFCIRDKAFGDKTCVEHFVFKIFYAEHHHVIVHVNTTCLHIEHCVASHYRQLHEPFWLNCDISDSAGGGGGSCLHCNIHCGHCKIFSCLHCNI